MSRRTNVAARVVSASALGAISVLHVLWASGSPWPAESKRQLTEAVIGSMTTRVSAAPTLVVAAGTGAGALLASGVLGDARMQRLGLRALGVAMLTRGIVGGAVTLALMGQPSPGTTFHRLDSLYYRPFAAILGVALLLSSRPELQRAQ